MNLSSLHNWVVTMRGEIWIRPEGIGTTISNVEGYTCLRYVSSQQEMLLPNSRFIKSMIQTMIQTMMMSQIHIDSWAKWCKKWCFKMSSFGKSAKSWISGPWCHKCLLNSDACLGEEESTAVIWKYMWKIHRFRGKPWVLQTYTFFFPRGKHLTCPHS